LDKIELAFKKLEEALKVAKLNFKNGYYSASTNRLYYTVFYVAKALLLKKGKNPKTQSGTIAIFGLEYVINGEFNKDVSKLFSGLEDDRGNADYDFSFESTKEVAKTDYLNAKVFIEECKKFL